MAFSVKISPHIHDLNFQMRDSCNGCCCPRGPKYPEDKDIIFIKRDGTFERFNLKKAKNESEAYQLTISRLQQRLDELAESTQVDSPSLRARIRVESGFELDELSTMKLSYSQLRRINSVFVSMVEEAKSPPVPPPAPRRGSSKLRVPPPPLKMPTP